MVQVARVVLDELQLWYRKPSKLSLWTTNEELPRIPGRGNKTISNGELESSSARREEATLAIPSFNFVQVGTNPPNADQIERDDKLSVFF
jgi:hypothetical protein